MSADPPEQGCLFDTDAILALLVSRPADAYLRWLSSVPREAQYTSALVLAELYEAACRQGLASGAAGQAGTDPVARLRQQLLPTITVLPFDAQVALTLAQLRAGLIPSATVSSPHRVGSTSAPSSPHAVSPATGTLRDLQVAATAIHHGLHLVTGRADRYAGVSSLALEAVPGPA